MTVTSADGNSSQAPCFHCGLPVMTGSAYAAVIDGHERSMCCAGCQAVAMTIVDGGLDKFYQYRDSERLGQRPDMAVDFLAYDLPEVQADILQSSSGGAVIIDLSIPDITCAACAWLIERHVGRLPGVARVAVNVSRHRCRVEWRLDDLALSELLGAFAGIGYRALPARETDPLRDSERHLRQYLLRLGVAGFGMMQVGMLALALYLGAFEGMDAHWHQFFRWVSLVVATPVVLFSARPFFSGAHRSLKTGFLTMDVPIALAVALAYLFSAWATITASGEVYFDAVSMLVFFLLLGRFLELRVRYGNEVLAAETSRLIPLSAQRLVNGGIECVAAKSLKRDDVIVVSEGEVLPADGVVIDGQSRVVEAILTGEQKPVAKAPGQTVSAGTVNTASRLTIRVEAVGEATRLATIVDMAESAEADKPRQVELANRLASWFVAGVLTMALAVYLVWSQYDAGRALWVTLSVLAVTCPCALSLATPLALAAATGNLRRRGILIRRSHVMQTLARVNRVVLDKTGTLTEGHPKIQRVVLAQNPSDGGSPLMNEDEVLGIAAALEQGCNHPIARAFDAPIGTTAQHLRYQVGAGVVGVLESQSYVLGSPAFVATELGLAPETCALPKTSSVSGQADPPSSEDSFAQQTLVLLASPTGPLAWFVLSDAIRPGARQLVASLASRNLVVEMLSGDHPVSVASLAEKIGIQHWIGDSKPEDKLAHIRSRQADGNVVLMVGDGVNDVPVLSGADVSMTLAEATDLTMLASDTVLLSSRLDCLVEALDLAKKTEAIIKQNILWALGYNGGALPLAALGWVPPWAAAIGMSLSSLIVVFNSMRLQGKPGEMKHSAMPTGRVAPVLGT